MAPSGAYRCPLAWQLRVNRTVLAVSFVGPDPTETLGSPTCCDAQGPISYHPVVGCNSGIEAAHEAARVHHVARRCGGDVAGRGARATDGDAGDRVPQRRIV